MLRAFAGRALAICVLVGLCFAVASTAGAVEKGPVGQAALLQLDLLPYLYPCSQLLHTSSHDPTGGNSDPDHFLSPTQTVIFDDKGPGCIYRMWFTSRTSGFRPTLYGNVQIYIDGVKVVDTPALTEDTASNPNATGGFMSGLDNRWPNPLAGNSRDSSCGFYNYVPIPYRTSCKIVMVFPYGYTSSNSPFYYNIDYKKYDTVDGITSYTGADMSTSAIKTLWSGVKSNPGGFDPKPSVITRTYTDTVTIPANASVDLCTITGPGCISRTRTRIEWGGSTDPNHLTKLFVKAAFDDRPADVSCLFGHFFGVDIKWPVIDVVGMLQGMNISSKWNYNYFPMPFARNAKVTIQNTNTTPVTISYDVEVSDMPDAQRLLDSGQIGYFCSTKDSSYFSSQSGVDYSLLDTTGRGKVVGVVYNPWSSGTSDKGYLEGDEHIFIDGSGTPAIHGTGTEDTFNSGWYMKWGQFSQPAHGYPVGITFDPVLYDTRVCTRLFMGESMSFDSHMKFSFEHGGQNDFSGGKERSTVFYYLSPIAGPFVPGHEDVLDLGNSAHRTAHGYTISPTLPTPTSHTASYDAEYGAATSSHTGYEFTGGYSEFHLTLQPNNYGVKLRRLLYYAYISGQDGQEAAVTVDGAPVGTWYDGGYNNNRGWRDSDFLIPAQYTQGKSTITVRITPAGKWTEYKYTAYIYESPTTAGHIPSVTDDGATTPTADRLHFTWTKPNEPVWNVIAYEYAIGTSSGGTQVRSWTDCGTSLSYTAMGLSLQAENTYYVSVRAKNGVGVWSTPGSSDGIALATAP